MSSLTWKQEKYFIAGYAGEICLFTITWRTVRTDPKWHMTTTLPGLQSGRFSAQWQNDSEDTLKEKAECVLSEWLVKTHLYS